MELRLQRDVPNEWNRNLAGDASAATILFGPKNGFRDLDNNAICCLGCLWWTTLLSLEYVFAKYTAPAMACFLDTRSESNCKEHLTDGYRAMAKWN